MAARPEMVAAQLLGPDLPELFGTRDWHNAAPTPAAIRGHLSDLGAPTNGVFETMGHFMPFDGADRRVLQAQYAEDIAWLRAGRDDRIKYIDDLGMDPLAKGRGSFYDTRAIQDRYVG